MDQPLSHTHSALSAESTLIPQELNQAPSEADQSISLSPKTQGQSTFSGESPLIQKLDHSFFHGESLSQTHSPIIRDLSTLSSDSPPISELDQSLELDQSISLTCSAHIQDQSTLSADSPQIKTTSQTRSIPSRARPSTTSSTCKILDVHVSFRRGSNSKPRPAQCGSSYRGLKSFFKSYSSFTPQKPPSTDIIKDIQDQSTSSAESPLIQVSSQSPSQVDQSVSLIHSPQIQDPSTLLAKSPLIKEQEQTLIQVDQSI